MFPKEERDALVKTLQDTITQQVPQALEESISNGAVAYQSVEKDGPKVFCLLLIERDHLELRFPVCPSVVASHDSFEEIEGTDACRLVIRKRTDLPGEILNTAIRAAAGDE